MYLFCLFIFFAFYCRFTNIRDWFFQDINTESVSITFAVNGVPQPTAVVVPRTDFPEDGFALFPHVLSRNYAFELNLGSRDEPWFPNPEDLADYIYLENAEPKVAGPVRPETRSECEVRSKQCDDFVVVFNGCNCRS